MVFRPKLKAFFIFAATLLVTLGFGLETAAAASKQAIIESHMTSLKITELEKMAPPYAAFMWAMANDAGFQSLKNSNHPELSYRAAFTRVLSLVKPSQAELSEAWLKKQSLNSTEAYEVKKAQELAEQIFKDHYPRLEQAEKGQTDWPTNPGRGLWRPTLPNHAGPALPNWNKLQLFSEAKVEDLIQGLIAPAPGTALYFEELEEVRSLGGVDSKNRTADQTEIAKFWVGGAGTVTPPGLWILIALQRLQEVPTNFSDSVSIMRTLSFALCDAGITAWTVKYQQQTWRPITAISEELGEKGWLPLISTPPFPGYVSGHSTFSAAAASVLAVILPLEGQPLRITSPDLKGVVRSFKSYKEAADEAGKSRIYGGIHVEADNKDGLILGRRVGCALLDKMFEYSCKE